MERPSKQEVDLCLMISQLDSETASNAAKLLALEVRALRNDRDIHSCGGGPTPCGGCCECMRQQFPDWATLEVEVARLRAQVKTMTELFELAGKKIDRLHAATESWRAEERRAGEWETALDGLVCADHVDEILKGGA